MPSDLLCLLSDAHLCARRCDVIALSRRCIFLVKSRLPKLRIT